ncbi:MAG: hypothetical protein LBO06_02925 [Bacteroidales bacterium]|jgi:hypothetical protein|nr:hypothetical protein [Bacteroidales bacterium]
MKRIVFICLLLAVHISYGQTLSNIETSENDLELIKVFYLDIDSTSSLEILKSEAENFILLQTKQYGRILSLVGEGNIALDDEAQLDTIYFEKGKRAFILPTYVNGSFYGATVHFIIYNYAFNIWYIFRIPFDNLHIEKGDNKNSDILRYMLNGDAIKYIFKGGILERVE